VQKKLEAILLLKRDHAFELVLILAYALRHSGVKYFVKETYDSKGNQAWP